MKYLRIGSVLIAFLITLITVTSCSSSPTNHSSDHTTKLDGNNVLFFVTSITCGLCRTQLVELNEVWDSISNEGVNVQVLTYGSKEEKKFLSELIELKYELTMLDDFSLPEQLGLVDTDNGITSIVRGYAIIIDGNVVESHVEDFFAKQAHEIIQRAKSTAT